MRSRFIILMMTFFSLFFNGNAFAAAFQLYEVGAPTIGTASVGQAALSQDASTAYFNPAGMAHLPDSQFLLGTQFIIPYIDFSKSRRATIQGNNGDNAGSLTPGAGLFYTYSLTQKLKLGLSFVSPYGGWLNYNDGWVGRYVVQYAQFYTLDLNPSIAYQITDWLAVGLGFTVEYENLHETIALPLTPLTELIDGQANTWVSDFGYGYNFGVLLTPTPATKIGFAYRSKINHNLRGNTTFLRLNVAPTVSTSMEMPQNIILSFAQSFKDQFTLLGELGWSNWSSMKNTVVHILGFSPTTVLNWHDTYRVGLGAQYQPSYALLFQTGVSYDSSPTHSSRRLPDLPMDGQIRVGLGMIYSYFPTAKVGVSYEYLNFGRAPIDNTSSLGRLVGHYSRNFAHVMQFSINLG